VFGPADRIFHATLLTDVDQFFQATGGALLAALCASLEFLELGDLPGLVALRGAPNVK